MSMNTPLEGLLRPPVEFYSSVTMLGGATLLFLFPQSFFMSFLLVYLASGALLILSLLRFYQGWKVLRYQLNLKRIRHYAMSARFMPVSKSLLFLGKGFLFTTKHTQRLRDLDLDYNLHFKIEGPVNRWLKQKALAWEHHSIRNQLLSIIRTNHALNPFRPYPETGGDSCIHGVSVEEENISINLSERASHLLVLGLPGMGKTRFAEMLIGQDIRRGDVVIVLDPKGDADLLKRMYIEAKLAGREDALMVFHLGFPECSAKYNPIGNFTRVTEVANRISNQLPSGGDSAAFKEFGWQFVNSIAMALVAMGEKPDYQKIKFYITKMDLLLEKYMDFWLPSIDPDFESWVTQYIEKHTTEKRAISRFKSMTAYVIEHDLSENPIFDDLHHACKYDKEYFSKITASLLPLLKKLTTGQSAELLSPDYEDIKNESPILDWLQVIRNKQIIYVGLDALTDREVASAVGNAMFSDLVSVAGRLYKNGIYDGFYKDKQRDEKPPRICVHSDEFNEIIGDEFIPLLNKGRGAGFTVTAYTQTWSDVEARLQTSAKAGQVAGNFGTVIMFRCKEVNTVNMLIEQLPTVPIMRVIPSSTSHDTPVGDEGVFYRSSNEDRFTHSEQPLVTQTDVLNLPKGQAFCLLEGGKLYKLRIPLPENDDEAVPDQLMEIINKMQDSSKEKEVS